MRSNDGPSPREEAREKGRHLAAVLTGAMEGTVQGMEQHEPLRHGQEALHEAGQITTSAAQEMRQQAQTPEGQEVVRGFRRTSERAKQGGQQAWEKGQEQLHHAREEVEHRGHEVLEKGQEQWHNVREEIEHRGHQAKEMLEKAQHEASARIHELEHAGREARHAPASIAHDVRAAAKARMKGMATGTGMYVMAGAVGLTGFIVLTVAIVNGLTALLGAPLGTFVAALIYGAGAAGLVAGAKAAGKRGREEAQRHVDDARDDVRSVTRPLGRVFQRRRLDQE